MTYVDYLRMVRMRHQALDLIPSLLVLMLAVLPVEGEPVGTACLTDGPQFACWLDATKPHD
jgi:hypothetical protein